MNKHAYTTLVMLGSLFIVTDAIGETTEGAEEVGARENRVVWGEERVDTGELKYEIKAERIEIIESPSPNPVEKTAISPQELRAIP